MATKYKPFSLTFDAETTRPGEQTFAEPDPPEAAGAYIFVGERRSRKAIALGVTWRDGRLAARTLFAALDAAGIAPLEQEYINLFEDDDTGWLVDRAAVALVADRADRGVRVVALGARVARYLALAQIGCTRLTHPAARGAIRKTERYHAHVRALLLGDVSVEP